MTRWRIWWLAVVLTPLACNDSPGGSTRPPLASASAHLQASPAGATERTYYLGNVSGHCAVYWVRGEARSVTHAELCPREVAPGERIRLAGHVCFRESSSFERALPVRCPKSLLYARRDDRQGKGERALPAASASAKQSPGLP